MHQRCRNYLTSATAAASIWIILITARSVNVYLVPFNKILRYIARCYSSGFECGLYAALYSYVDIFMCDDVCIVYLSMFVENKT